jgi:predicted enzyme related to lactoylglutathione lyase
VLVYGFLDPGPVLACGFLRPHPMADLDGQGEGEDEIDQREGDGGATVFDRSTGELLARFSVHDSAANVNDIATAPNGDTYLTDFGLPVPDIGEARDFYANYLGLIVEEFNMGWVARFRSPDGRAVVQLVTRDATAPHDSAISVYVGDGVDEAYEEAKRRGFEIVHPLTTESWGIRRFLVRAPDGNVININSHKDA